MTTIDDKLTRVILSLEEAIFDFEYILMNYSQNIYQNIDKKTIDDIISSKELAQSSRDMAISIMSLINGKIHKKYK